MNTRSILDSGGKAVTELKLFSEARPPD